MSPESLTIIILLLRQRRGWSCGISSINIGCCHTIQKVLFKMGMTRNSLLQKKQLDGKPCERRSLCTVPNPNRTFLQDMESSNEPVSPFDPYEHIAGLTLHEESPLKAIPTKPPIAPEYKPRLSTSVASARGQLEGFDDSSNASYNGKITLWKQPPWKWEGYLEQLRHWPCFRSLLSYADVHMVSRWCRIFRPNIWFKQRLLCLNLGRIQKKATWFVSWFVSWKQILMWIYFYALLWIAVTESRWMES